MKNWLFVLFMAGYLYANPNLSVITYLERDEAIVHPNFPPELAECHQILVIDGPCDPNQEYAGFTQVVRCSSKLYDGKAIALALQMIDTPFFFVHYNGNRFLRPIDVNGVIRTMESNAMVKHVRINHKQNVMGCFRDQVIRRAEGATFVPLLKVFDWTTCDHFSSKSHYQKNIVPLLIWPWSVEAFLSEKLQFNLTMSQAYKQFGTHLYGWYGEGPYICRVRS